MVSHQASEKTIQDLAPLTAFTTQPRAQGAIRVSAKLRDGATVLDRLHQSGSLKTLFPRSKGQGLTTVLLNTAGGITGGDRFDQRLIAQPGTDLTVTTQAAERAYRAARGRGRICTGLRVGAAARLDWLPQETILFDGAVLVRRLDVELAPDARCLIVESLIFGRAAMGETLHDLDLDDHITVSRSGQVLFADRTRLTGDAAAHLSRTATGQGAGAMASLIFAAPDAADLLTPARERMPPMGGISQPATDLVFARLLAEDGFALRRALVPLINVFRAAPLPKVWMM